MTLQSLMQWIHDYSVAVIVPITLAYLGYKGIQVKRFRMEQERSARIKKEWEQGEDPDISEITMMDAAIELARLKRKKNG